MSVNFFQHSLTASDSSLVADVLSTPFLTSGKVGKNVEEIVCDYFGISNCLLTNSWTNGAIATLLALDIQPGDEVIVPAQTFIATANVVELLGARPVFVDVDNADLLVTTSNVMSAITDRTKAVIVVHLYGQMCDLSRLYPELQKRSISLIEDAAHCFEGQRDGYRPGTHSDAAIFSFYATKNVTCGEGGAIITRHDNLAEEIRKTRLHGMSAGAADRFSNKKYNHWDMSRLGSKANLPDLLACLLPKQIADVENKLNKRKELADRYRQFCRTHGIRHQAVHSNSVSAEHLFPIWVPMETRDDFILFLNEQGIQVAVNYRAVHTMSFYREKYAFSENDFPVSYEWGAGTITLPLYPDLSVEKQDLVLNALAEAINKFGYGG